MRHSDAGVNQIGLVDKLRFVAIYLPACSLFGAILRLLNVPESIVLMIITAVFVAAFFISIVLPGERGGQQASDDDKTAKTRQPRNQL